MSVMLSAASCLDWAAQLTGQRDLVRLVESAQARGVNRQSPFFLPYLTGERTPYNDPHARGVFFGIRSDTDCVDLAVAVLEGVALAFADGLDVLLEKGGSIDDISVTGGGARLPYWGQLLAAALNRPLTYRVGGEVGAALGAARLGRLALGGRQSSEEVCAAPPVDRVVQPDAALSSLLGIRRRTFVRLYQDLKNTFVEYS
jgi:xylulokinase